MSTGRAAFPDGYRAAAQRYLGLEAAGEYLSAVHTSPVQMALIVIEPQWVGLLGFQIRLPGSLDGETPGSG